ncbi:MAG TPA: type I-C CRISPR-associated protein Cas8c/Csd1, partial [Rhizobiales bacterium]|nr:type I-C CRISPR-associated protein Cas8c/Csd1 [Hyphomicrobiales bacterium]
PFKRTSGVKANLFWDKTAYVLGVTLKKDARGKPVLDEDENLIPELGGRTPEEHAAFVKAHEALLAGSADAGLLALLGFVRSWQPDMYAARGFPLDLLDENLVFRLDGDCDDNNQPRFIHDRPAARALLSNRGGQKAEESLCLVSGTMAPVARLHPAIKGVQGAQSSGASLVAFNADAYESFGKAQGENAPVSESAAFAYGTALNTLLRRDYKHSVRIGDTTVVFWAETPDRDAANSLEALMHGSLNPPDAQAEANKLRDTLRNVASGRGAAPPPFDPDTRIYILGLAPNAARLSVRFWRPGTFGDFAANVLRFWDDLALQPPGWESAPAAWSLLYETAVQGRAENIPPRLGGDLMQAVLGGTPYPRTLLSAVVQRIRADGTINARRTAICCAFIRRNLEEKEFPMSLDRDNPDPAYRLGRLFAVLEMIQQKALPGLNATIRDRYFAAASATPARVFPLLAKNATHHLAKMRKSDGGGLAHWMDAEMGEIWNGLSTNLPRSLNLEDQGRFIAGYYHQRWAKKDGNTTEAQPESDNGSTDQ